MREPTEASLLHQPVLQIMERRRGVERFNLSAGLADEKVVVVLSGGQSELCPLLGKIELFNYSDFFESLDRTVNSGLITTGDFFLKLGQGHWNGGVFEELKGLLECGGDA